MNTFTKLALSTLALAATVALLSGCEETPTFAPKSATAYTTTSIIVYCDKGTNVEYLVNTKHRSGGMTLRYNLDGTPKSCN